MITMSAINIYAITNSSDEEFPELLLLHRVAVNLHPRGLFRPLVGHDGIFHLYLWPHSQTHLFKS